MLARLLCHMLRKRGETEIQKEEKLKVLPPTSDVPCSKSEKRHLFWLQGAPCVFMLAAGGMVLQ